MPVLPSGNIVIFEVEHLLIEARLNVRFAVTLAGSASRKWHVGPGEIQLRDIQMTGRTVVPVVRRFMIELERKVAQDHLHTLLRKRIHIIFRQAGT